MEKVKVQHRFKVIQGHLEEKSSAKYTFENEERTNSLNINAMIADHFNYRNNSSCIINKQYDLRIY